MGTIGVQWGFLGDPEGLQLNAVGAVGSGFLTTDRQEFFYAELGVGGSYNVNRAMQLYVSVNGNMQFRKSPNFGFQGYGGIRYMFD